MIEKVKKPQMVLEFILSKESSNKMKLINIERKNPIEFLNHENDQFSLKDFSSKPILEPGQ